MGQSEIICVDFTSGVSASSPEELLSRCRERSGFKRCSADMGHRGGSDFSWHQRKEQLARLNPPNTIDFETAKRELLSHQSI